MTEPSFCLKWGNFHGNLSEVFHKMLLNENMVDVTIACEGASLKAHKMILAASSPFFQSLFMSNPCKHPIVILKDIRFVDLKVAIDFMYKGEINVTQSQLAYVLKAAETLKIKGLTDIVQRHRDQNPVEHRNNNNISGNNNRNIHGNVHVNSQANVQENGRDSSRSIGRENGNENDIITPDNLDNNNNNNRQNPDSSHQQEVPMVTMSETENISHLMIEPLNCDQLPGTKRRSNIQRTSAFARVQRYRDETFYEINNILHCKACGEILNHKKLSVIKHHIESQKHKLNKKRMNNSSQT